MPESMIPPTRHAYAPHEPSPQAHVWIFVLMVCAFVPSLAGCSSPTPESIPVTSASPTSLPAPTLTPLPAPEFEVGMLDLPAGVVLLLSNATSQVCSLECVCPAVEGLRRGYSIEEERLYVYRDAMDPSWEGESLPAMILAYGDFEHALAAIRELPFDDEGHYPILAALQDGTVVYEWDGHPYRLGIGQAWQIARSADHGGGCVITDTSSLRNLGLWRGDLVEIVK